MKKLSHLIIIISIILISGLLINFNFTIRNNHKNLFTNQNQDIQIIIELKNSYTHDPLNISGNNDFTLIDGVKNPAAKGTYDDPFIIENLTINGNGNKDCIFINNTNLYFIIQNCTLINSGIAKYAISLKNVTNGFIYNNSIISAPINLVDSNFNNISWNRLYDEIYKNSSIILGTSHNNTINNNFLTRCEEIGIYTSHNNTIINNVIKYCIIGIRVVSSCNNTIKSNDISNSDKDGIWIRFGSNNTKIIYNYIYDNTLENIKIDAGCEGTIEQGNIFTPPGENGSKGSETNDDDDENGKAKELDLMPYSLIIIISILLAIIGSGVLILIHRRLLRKKKEKDKILKEIQKSEPQQV